MPQPSCKALNKIISSPYVSDPHLYIGRVLSPIVDLGIIGDSTSIYLANTSWASIIW